MNRTMLALRNDLMKMTTALVDRMGTENDPYLISELKIAIDSCLSAYRAVSSYNEMVARLNNEL